MSFTICIILRVYPVALKGRGGGHNSPPPLPTLKPLYFKKLPICKGFGSRNFMPDSWRLPESLG